MMLESTAGIENISIKTQLEILEFVAIFLTSS